MEFFYKFSVGLKKSVGIVLEMNPDQFKGFSFKKYPLDFKEDDQEGKRKTKKKRRKNTPQH